jgi:hypothetical protein
MATSTRTARPMTADIAGHTIDEALEALTVLCTEMGLFPGDATEHLALAGRIRDWATGHHISDLDELTGNIAENLLRDLTGVTQLTQFPKAKQAEALHQARNALMALRGAVLVARTNHTTKRGQRPAKDSLAAGLPPIADRTQLRSRALRDDEILLARLIVEIDLMENAPTAPIHTYLFAETGQTVMENTKIERDHLDHPLTPTRVIGSGVWKSGERELKLDTYVRSALARTLRTLRPGNQPLSYKGAEPGTKAASASMNPVLTRYLARAGVTGGDITAKSVNLWRPDHILRTERNLKKAVRVHGMRTTNLLHALHYTTDETSLHKKKVTLRDHNGKTVAKVPSWHVRGA